MRAVERQQKPEAPLSVIILRIVVPLGILLAYWVFRLPEYFSSSADGGLGIELFIALIATLIGGVVAAGGLVALYRRIAG
ncbi:MAG TPA: hypothetical protein VGL46_09285 [Pseudonocardiaceae bacterium]|jgi:high-affinity K+ transport system ATPase subunit B